MPETEKRKTMRLLRRAVELSQQATAKKAGFSRALLSHYESGRAELQPDDLLQLETVLRNAVIKKSGRLTAVKSLLAGPNALAEKLYGFSSFSEANEIGVPMEELRRWTEAAEKRESSLLARIEELEQRESSRDAELARVSAAVRDANDRCDKMTADRGQRILEEEATRS
jgi:transcriptional regulator with XRE-family HTH domain